jgi:hypothetical protein
MMFHTSFDVEIYRSLHPDLAHMNDEELVAHYENWGINEGRICSAIRNRSDFIKQIPTSQKCLEIGPFNRPILAGDNIFFADILDTDSLRNRASELGLDTANVPTISWVLADGSLAKIDETFETVLSSHNIEHQVDLVRHLDEVAKLLINNGHYFLLIPDSRFCFDHFITPSTVADVLASHYEGRRQHSLKSVIEHRALTTHNDSVQHWAGNHGSSTINAQRVLDAITEFEINRETGVDVHAWQFTPQSFEQIIQCLHDLKLTQFVVERIYPTVRNDIEFAAILRKVSETN